MSYLRNDGLSFNVLRQANIKRQETDKYNICADTWTHAQWMQATVGELGELANILKKIDRGDFTLEDVKEDVANELADVQTYLDIMANKLGIDLGKATVKKFNIVSERIGSRVYIGVDGDWHMRPKE